MFNVFIFNVYYYKSCDISISFFLDKPCINRLHLPSCQIRTVMKRIFHQKLRGFDSSVRSRALDIILSTGASEEELRAIMRETNDPWNMEYDMYVQGVLYNLMELNDTIR